MKEIRVGMIGYGAMGHVHRYAAESIRHFYPSEPYDVKIAAVCAPSERTRQEAQSAGIGKVAATADELICDPEIDVIDVCTPNVYHYEQVRQALLCGKHVYCEKPLAVTVVQAEELAAMARDSGCRTQVVFNNRHLPAIRRAKQMTDAGVLGRILSFRCAYRHASCVDPARVPGWKQDKSICGGGVWYDLGSHAVDLIYHLCGEFAVVEGRGQIAFPERQMPDGTVRVTNADEAFYAFATLKSGAVGTLEANKLATGANDDLTLELFGERGSLRFSLMDPNYLEWYDATAPGGDFGGSRGYTRIECVGRIPDAYALGGQKAPVGWLRGHMESYRAFLKSIAEGTDPHPSFAEAAHVQWVLERAYRSAER